MKTCFLFPGQGAQYPEMGKDLWEYSKEVKDLFSLVSDISGKDMKSLLFDGTAEDLKATDNAQLAITLANVAASSILKERGIEPDGCAGFSLGEYAALWQSSVLSTEDLFRLVKIRGEVMEKACRKLDTPEGRPGMAAVVGLTSSEVSDALLKVDGKIYLANDNSPIQSVIAGEYKSLEMAKSIMDVAGAMKYVILKVSGPFHTPLMEEAKLEYQDRISSIPFNNPQISLYSNVTGKLLTSGDEAKGLAIKQMVSPVLWVAEEGSILSDGYDNILEVGPGKVLRGLWKSFNKQLKCKSAGKIVDIDELV